MTKQQRVFLLVFIALVALGAAVSYDLPSSSQPAVPAPIAATPATQIAAAAEPSPPSLATLATSSAVASSPISAKRSDRKEKANIRPGTTARAAASAGIASSSSQVARLESPYSAPRASISDLNTDARAALVNILCMPRGGGSFSPISGSGVIIDPRGIVLTNAHVAQYVLLSQSPKVDLQCAIRAGAPAHALWSAEVLYIPPVWVQTHVGEINAQHPQGTGEHDYGLLYITGSLSGGSLPAPFPFLQPDTREGIAFQGDQVLVASYPAEFLGGMAAENDLYPASSVTTIGRLLTFSSSSIDVLSLGGIIEAQSGSPGGAVVNAWDRLVGLIVTTSEGATTAARDLHALSLSYISRDLAAQSGYDLPEWLQTDPASTAKNFNAMVAPGLLKLYIAQLSY